MNLGIKGKNAVVTGGTHGIGRAIALALAEEGCNVAVCSRNKTRVDKTVKAIKAKKVKSIGLPADVLIPSDIENMMKTVLDSWGTVHILVNNVGGGGRWGSDDVIKTSEEIWYDVFNKNAMAAVRFTKLVLPYMKKQKWGRVVTVSSTVGFEGNGRPWYTIAKTAEIILMKSLGLNQEFTRKGITFNCICPGPIMILDTGWATEKKKNKKSFEKIIGEKLALGRMGTPEEVANVVTFLCSEQASLVNGAAIIVDGGGSRII